MTADTLPRGQQILLLQADDQRLTATGRHDVPVAQKMVKAGLLRHRHGLIFDLTPAGRKAREALRASS